MLRFVIALTVACAVVAGDDFAKKYAFSKVMSNCFGEDNYNDWAKEVFSAMKECYHEEAELPEYHTKDKGGEEDYGEEPIFVLLNPQGQGQRFKFPFRNFRQKREAMYTGDVLKKMIMKVKAKAGNYTCVLKKMNYIDEDFNLDFDYMKREIRSIRLDSDLKEDLVEAIDYCKEFTQCLPSKDGPIPKKMQEIMGFFKCDRKTRMKICMKHDIIKYMSEFDVSALPFAGDKDEGEIAEKLLYILWSVEAKDDFQLY